MRKVPPQYPQNLRQSFFAVSVPSAHAFCVSFAFLQSTFGVSAHAGVQIPQNLGQYSRVGGADVCAHIPRVLFIC